MSRFIQYARWSLIHGLITCLPDLILQAMISGTDLNSWYSRLFAYRNYYVAIFAVGAVVAFILLNLLARVSRGLEPLAFPLASLLIPIVIGPVWNYVDCRRWWNCAAIPEIDGLSEQFAMILWMIPLFIFSLVLAFVYQGTKRPPRTAVP